MLDNTIWMVFFKSVLANVNCWPLAWHALVDCSDTRIVSAIDGLALHPSKWYVDDRPSFRGMVVGFLLMREYPKLIVKSIVTAYPPNVPSRDPITWCRIMQHVQVLMVSDAPEFLLGLANLDKSIRAEASQHQGLETSEIENFDRNFEKVSEERQKFIRDRLRNLLIARASICSGDNGPSVSNHIPVVVFVCTDKLRGIHIAYAATN